LNKIQLQKGTHNTYFGNIKEGIKSSLKGLKLSIRHFKNARKKMPLVNVTDDSYFSQNIGTVTLQYPNETIPVPDIGRYRLYNEMDDCIVCDKCAKVCPVDCIDIEPIKSSELIGNASDGSPIRLYAAKFDIDMAKCCFCGLCTTVCPTECLTMTKAYDFSEFDVKDFNYHYANLSPDEAEQKKRNYEQFVLEKEAAKLVKPIIEATEKPIVGKPVFRPGIKKPEVVSEEKIEEVSSEVIPAEVAAKPRPVFRPAFKKQEATSEEKSEEIKSEVNPVEVATKPRPVFRPAVKKQGATSEEKSEEIKSEINLVEVATKPRPVFRPALKKLEATSEEKSEEIKSEVNQEEVAAKPRPVFRPAVKKPKEE
jgi:formate hydrogenlyase subunit 6/NADH:ubiquinone oxidoreductase subunit I